LIYLKTIDLIATGSLRATNLILGRKLKVKAEARILGGKKANPRKKP
jgi:hypothetical protein